MTVLHGDCLDMMPLLGENCVDAIVTDPPYGLTNGPAKYIGDSGAKRGGFMGKDWDHGVPGKHFWQEAIKVLKPGGYLLAFGGTRTYHRLACAIEDAGFELRDTIMWVYGSGFPKSLDISKAIDKAAGAERKVTREARVVDDYRLGHINMDPRSSSDRERRDNPTTDAARQWEGWGTALKPAHEPIIVARKPLDGTVAANVLRWGTGGLNIDGCRIETTENLNGGGYRPRANGNAWQETKGMNSKGRCALTPFQQPTGRWPANLIHDGSDEVLALFPGSKGQQAVTGVRKQGQCYGTVTNDGEGVEPRNDTGSAARFFYCAKASRTDRNEGLEGWAKKPLNWSSGTQSPGTFQSEGTDRSSANHHPTVKPTDLMRYLCRLVTPPGGLVLDPFAGSGSTGKAALLEEFRFLGIEKEEAYVAIANARLGR